MSWRDDLQSASFRGVPFHYRSADGAGGRRVVVHEYPGRDEPFTEDLGRKAREFAMECYVIGRDYFSARDRFLEALEASGPGELIHPYRGALTVQVGSFQGPSETTEEGGMARFSVTFHEAGENRYPSTIVDSPALLRSSADDAEAPVAESFASGFSVAAVPAFVLAAARAVLSEVAEVARFAARIVDVAGTVAEAADDVDAIGDSAYLDPSGIAATVFDLVGSVAGTVRKASDLLRLERFHDFGASYPEIEAGTPAREREVDNRAALVALIRRVAAVEEARAVAAIEFGSYEEAASTRDTIADRLDVLMDGADDVLYRVLSELRSSVVIDVDARAADLARTVSYTPRISAPSLVVAHALYGDAFRSAEVVDRNAVLRPGFIPPNQPLSVEAFDATEGTRPPVFFFGIAPVPRLSGNDYGAPVVPVTDFIEPFERFEFSPSQGSPFTEAFAAFAFSPSQGSPFAEAFES